MARQYTDREKGHALAVLDMEGGNVSKASRLTGIPWQTIDDWKTGEHGVNADVQTLREGKRLALDVVTEDMAYLVLDAMRTNGSLKKANAQQLAITYGILTEKMLLLRGQPTAIYDNVSALTDAERSQRVLDLLAKAQDRRVGLPTGDTIDSTITVVSEPVDDGREPPAR